MTDYLTDYKNLGKEFSLNLSSKKIKIEGHKEFELLSLPFTSNAGFVYPEDDYYSERDRTFTSLLKFYCNNNKYSNELIFKKLEWSDRSIAENNKFRIPVLIPSTKSKNKKATFLIHGLNEKHWDKYLPWAVRIMEETSSPVILFPIAFHMNR
ncbi:MAG: DUF6051 family protein, partial [Spirochaetales bacterium]|nr:DUF6051 family protein [Spirochaetales bacterium]